MLRNLRGQDPRQGIKKRGDPVIFGKHINRYYLKHLPALLLGLLAILAVERTPVVWLKPVAVLPFLLMADILEADYGMHGVLLMLLFGLTDRFPWKRWIQFIGMVLIFADMRSSVLLIVFGVDITLQMFGALAIVPIAFYSGKKHTHNKAVQWGFYLFYPAHLLILHFMR